MQNLFSRSYRYIALMGVIAFAFVMSVSAAPLDNLGPLFSPQFTSGNTLGTGIIGNIEFDTDGNIYLQSGTSEIEVYDSGYNFVKRGGGSLFAGATDLAIGVNGDIYVSNSVGSEVVVMDNDFNLITNIATTNPVSGGIALDSNGILYTLSSTGVEAFDTNNAYASVPVALGITLTDARRLAIGPNDTLFIGEFGNVVQVLDASFNLVTTVATNTFREIDVDSAGNLYVTRDYSSAAEVVVFDGANNYAQIATTGNIGAAAFYDIELYGNTIYLTNFAGGTTQSIFGFEAYAPAVSLPVGCYIDAPANVDEGTTFTATVRCDGVADFYGFQFGTTPTGDGSTAATSYTVGEFDTNAANDVLGGSNTLNLFAQSHTGNDIASGDFTLGSYNLTADSYLTADGSVVITLDNFNASDINGAPLSVLATAPDATVIINDIILSQLTGDVTLASDGVVTALVDAILDIDGTSYGPNAGAGTTIAITVNQQSNVLSITVTADLESHLECASTVAIVDGTNDVATAIGTLTLAAGDVVTVADNGINIQDATAIGAVFGGAPTAEEDVNKDGTVDVFDLVHVGRNYNAVSGTCN